jgi:hypothetical protein
MFFIFPCAATHREDTEPSDFLHNIGVPEVTNAACFCGHERETPKHITVFCLYYQNTREQLRINGRLDFRELLTTVEGKESHQVVVVEKNPRSVPARRRADRKLGFGINPSLHK